MPKPMTRMIFSADTLPPLTSEPPCEPWHILIVDDEPSVHDVTRLTLNRLELFGQPVKLHSAFSAAEARHLLESDTQYCLAFVDVVMETPHAGLELVEWIRNDRKNSAIRLILRTGQAGMAPESDVIRNYDINDYKSKTELTAQGLATCVFNAVRGYKDITTIGCQLAAFRLLIDTSAGLLKLDDLDLMASSALQGLLNILQLERSTLYLARRQHSLFAEPIDTLLSCGNGAQQCVSNGLEGLPEAIRARIEQTFSDQSTVASAQDFVGYFATGQDAAVVLWVEYPTDESHFRAGLIELYASQLVLIFENLMRQNQLASNQKELMYIVGDAIEARSLETGSHVKRVALICEFFAHQLALPREFIEAIKIAAPLHDIGKIAISEAILHKPGKFTPEEWAIMQSHATIGAQILEKSKLPVACLGARLARWHHENWDGSGYPDGLVGDKIPMEARIMAMADVFDALGSQRSYKEPWHNDAILAYIVNQSGIKFDPDLVDILRLNIDELVLLRNQIPD